MKASSRSVLLIAVLAAIGVLLTIWKQSSLQEAAAAAANAPEPTEFVEVAIAREFDHQRSSTAIGTVIAARSISVRNELPGTVKRTALTPGRIVEAGEVLVALDVSVEEAELRALQAQAQLASTQYDRIQRMHAGRAASEMEVDSARAERDVALAQIARTQAIIERKTIRAPFRARIGLSDVHPGQYLNEGTLLTTLQGVDEGAYVDFAVSQQIAAQLAPGDAVRVIAQASAPEISAQIMAVDARVDPATRNAMVRAQIADAKRAPAPGASVRVQTAVGESRIAVAIPASAVRKGPEGEHVFVLAQDDSGQLRARERKVQIEAAAGDRVVVLNGLSAGELVAASGSFKLRDEALVQVIEQPNALAANATPSTTHM